MSDVRFARAFEAVRSAVDPTAAIRRLSDAEVVAALVTAAQQGEAVLANVLATEAQNRLHRGAAVFDHVGEGLITVDVAGRVTRVNPQAALALGCPAEALMGRDACEVFGFRDASGVPLEPQDCPCHLAMSGARSIRRGDLFLTRGDGSLFSASCTAAPVHADGVVSGAVVSFLDVTAQREAEEALAASEERFRAVFENALDPMLIADDRGRYVEANPAALDFVGVAREELLRMSVFDLAPPEAREATLETWQSFLDKGEMRGEFVLRRPDGVLRRADFSARARILPNRHLSILRPAPGEPGSRMDGRGAG